MKLGIHQYKIIYKDIEDCGEIDRDKNTITIRSNLSDTESLVSLWHEKLHILNNELSETLVESLAQQIVGVLKDNRLCYNEKHDKRTTPKKNKR